MPPNKDPHEAVRAGMDFLVNMGDTWLSNTPRRGAVALRTAMQHSETQLCIACHPAQFTTRGYLKAVQNGYAPTQRAGLEFLTDRIYNNARPLYGEPDTNWVRIIYTARTEASRLPLIAHAFEQNVTHDPPRKKFDVPYATFLKIHYKGVTELPGDEADGCEPDVSPFEIATQSWQTFNLAYNETPRPEWLAERDHVEKLAVPDEPKNVIDLSWKIMFFSEVNREQIRSANRRRSSTSSTSTRLRKAAGRIHSTRRPSLPTSSPTTPCWPWPKPAAAPRPTSTWRAPSKPCSPRNGPREVGKAIRSTRDSIRPSAPRSLR